MDAPILQNPHTERPIGKKRKAPAEVPKYLTEQEIALLFEAIKEPRDRAMFRLIYHRGLRASEVGNLNLSDYQEVAGRPPIARLTVRRLKGSRSGTYELTEVEHSAMRAWVRLRGRQPGPLFLSRNHRAISRQRVFELMRRYCHAAGIAPERAHPHALKHSCVTHVLARTNGDIIATQHHVGHADVRSTMVYTAFTQQEKLAQQLKDWK